MTMKFIDALNLFKTGLTKYLPHFSGMSTKTYIDISSLAANTEWTVPADGYICGWIMTASDGTSYIDYYINGVLIKNRLNTLANFGAVDRIFISKNDTFKWGAFNNVTINYLRFYYCNGTVPK